ncbi:protein of unknown function [Georgfuchsia toluolica]|uniref:Uncharacterized protein n=1 Tax=Georgfuchsia toluolica TaxID=424218 RepID=A0A916J4T4_9PROT|nr:protein of unknown function [Georgfuchsia toluolica]
MPFDFIAVILKNGIEQTPYILKHYSLRAAFIYEPNGLRKEVALIVCPKLLASF